MSFSVRSLFAFTSVLVLGGGALAAQTTGKVQGSVTGPDGAPLAHAQVTVTGTSFGAVSDDKGYYFINNIPAGLYRMQAQYIGMAPGQAEGVRILAGQTLTQNFPLQNKALTVTGINVVAAADAAVPRDQVTSKTIVSGDLVQNLPVQNVRNVVALTPGVVESGNGLGVSIRGGRPGEEAVYIDGAPAIRQAQIVGGAMGASPTNLVQTNAVEEASITTGAIAINQGNAQSGVIAVTTRSGGEKLSGAFSAQSDGMFANTVSTGYNRFEGSVGGPVPGFAKLRFFLSGVLQGQTSPFRSYGAADVPSYTMNGVDTTVHVVGPSGAESITLPKWVQYSGQCDAAQNDGVSCQGNRLPYDWTTNLNLQGKVSYFYGSGSSIALSAIAEGDQNRNYPNQVIGDPALYSGTHTWARDVVLNWDHSIFKQADRALSLNLNLSYATNQSISGVLDPATEVSTRNPMGGMEFSTLNFGGFGQFAGDFFSNPEAIIRNIRSNDGERVPLPNRTDLNASQPYRMNPYAMQSGGFFTEGVVNGAQLNNLYTEKRLYGRAQVDWQANRYHRFNFGGELQRSDVAAWNGILNNQIFSDAYHTKPTNGAAWVSDRLDLGDVVLEMGVRYDYFNSNALFSNTPGFTFSDPTWNQSSALNDTAYANSLARTYTPGVGHSTLSPRLQVSFPITDNTDFRLSYSHQVQTPDVNTMLQGINSDLTFTNSNDRFGRDVGFGKTILFEFGVRHAFTPDLVVDLSGYNKSKVADLSYRIFGYNDPTNPGRILNINVLTNGDFGYDRGLDLRIDRRMSNWLTAQIGYTFEVANGTGSSPYSYLTTAARSISGVTGNVLPPAEQPRAVNDQRTHNIVGAVSFTVPRGWQDGTTVGSILKDVSAFATFQVLSGLPYTPLTNVGGGATAPGTNFGLTAAQAGDINSATTPWTKNLDLRINKGLKLGRLDVTAFADIRNLFNWKNITGLFAETNDVTNSVFEHNTIASEFTNLTNEAQRNGALRSDGSVSLSNCASWTGESGPVNCVELQRAEARFGNGDGVYSVAEENKALSSYYNLFFGPYGFNGPGRSMRLGFEVAF
ncbi:MAG TPA: TonB-dependent receptor [Gemmatimonadales bacterium]|nr:TonB-dependent receptor [Gemmatimonadales bacterium]